MRLIHGRQQWIADYVALPFPVAQETGFKPYYCFGAVNDAGRLVGGLVLTDYRPHDIAVSIYAETPTAFTPGFVRYFFKWVFEAQTFTRLSAEIAGTNKRCQRLALGLGFKPEGIRPKAYGYGEDDLHMFGMLKSDCRFLT